MTALICFAANSGIYGAMIYRTTDAKQGAFHLIFQGFNDESRQGFLKPQGKNSANVYP